MLVSLNTLVLLFIILLNMNLINLGEIYLERKMVGPTGRCRVNLNSSRLHSITYHDCLVDVSCEDTTLVLQNGIRILKLLTEVTKTINLPKFLIQSTQQEIMKRNYEENSEKWRIPEVQNYWRCSGGCPPQLTVS